jgi:stearoyl-CoA desaturase (delta-9 desaturase)
VGLLRVDGRAAARHATREFGGEGWHNNHHRFAASARQGFFAGEIDLSYRMLRLLERIGLVRNLRPVPAAVIAEGRGR